MKFRKLRADEIECRIAQISENPRTKKYSVSLLLYKDARCDMKLLDETVGAMNWQRSHQVIDGKLCCAISIWDDEKKTWISKQDVGTESYTEKEKGLFSDSYKRSGVNWGIGRELYTAPQIWVSDCKIVEKDGKPKCYDRFRVKSIHYDGDTIDGLTIINEKTRKVAFAWGKDINEDTVPGLHVDELSDVKSRFIKACADSGYDPVEVMKEAGWEKGKATVDDYTRAEAILNKLRSA